jgi:cytochrome c oxidase subunit II
MRALKDGVFALAGALALLAGTVPALAQGEVRKPEPWQLGMQQPVTLSAEKIYAFHDFLLVVITLITIFVLGLMIYACVRFRESANPVPTRTTHNTVIEILWTAIPVLILVIIAIPSFRILYYGDKAVNPDMTVKVTGSQWYWNYSYPDLGIAFDSRILEGKDFDPAKHIRELDVDNRLVVPSGKAIQVLVTSNDVFHSFFLPSAAVQIYAVGGRTNETWMQFTKEGVFYGQCNQVCGTNHSAMPIVVEVLPPAQFDAWLAEAKKKFAIDDGAAPATKVAQATFR